MPENPFNQKYTTRKDTEKAEILADIKFGVFFNNGQISQIKDAFTVNSKPNLFHRTWKRNRRTRNGRRRWRRRRWRRRPRRTRGTSPWRSTRSRSRKTPTQGSPSRKMRTYHRASDLVVFKHRWCWKCAEISWQNLVIHEKFGPPQIRHRSIFKWLSPQ